jgi:hypothetical protein
MCNLRAHQDQGPSKLKAASIYLRSDVIAITGLNNSSCHWLSSQTCNTDKGENHAETYPSLGGVRTETRKCRREKALNTSSKEAVYRRENKEACIRGDRDPAEHGNTGKAAECYLNVEAAELEVCEEAGYKSTGDTSAVHDDDYGDGVFVADAYDSLPEGAALERPWVSFLILCCR